MTFNSKMKWSVGCVVLAVVSSCLVNTLPGAIAQGNCPFTGDFINIGTVPDSKGDRLWSGTTINGVNDVTSASILSTSVLASIMEISYTNNADSTEVWIDPTASFKDFVDNGGTTEIIYEVAVNITTPTANYTCPVSFTMTDTNNQVPTFSQPGSITLSVPRNHDLSVPINWRLEDMLTVSDGDKDESFAKVTVTSSDDSVLQVESKEQLGWGPPQYATTYGVLLFLDTLQLQDATTFTLTASDGPNQSQLQVEITLEPGNTNNPPEFQNLKYCHILEKMPAADEVIALEVLAKDPDDPNTDMRYEFGVDYLQYNDADGTFSFNRAVPELEGKEAHVTVTATEQNTEGKSSEVTLTLKFPEPPTTPSDNPEFTRPFYATQFQTLPISQGSQVVPELEASTGDGTETIQYRLTGVPPPFIQIENNELVFNVEVNEDTDFGEFGANRVVVFQVEAVVQGDDTRSSAVTVVLTFPLPDSSTTTTTTPGATTPCDCGTTDTPPTTTPTTGSTCEPCVTDPTPCPTTPCEPCVTEPTTGTTSDPCDCDTTGPSTGTPPDPTTNCPPTGSTCEPCNCDSTPTGTPPTTTPCPVTCPPTTECPVTCPPPTTACPECPSTCPPPTTACPECPSTCPPPTECPSTCPPPTHCPPSEQEGDCSNTGLVAGIIVTSVLCVISMLGAGYCYWLLRKGNNAPSFAHREDSFLIPNSRSEDKLETTFGSNKPTAEQQPSSFFPRLGSLSGGGRKPSVGGTTTTLSGGGEPGFKNPSFADDAPVARRFSVPGVSSSDPGGTTTGELPAAGDDNSSTALYSQPTKKSNIKPPKEIEPDYEERPKPKEKPIPARKVSMKEVEPKKGVLFAPENEVFSIENKDAAKAAETSGNDLDEDSVDSTYERL